MKLHRIAVTLIGAMFLFAGISAAQQVKTDYDRSANFSQYKTYSWEHVKTKDSLFVDRIKDAVNGALAARGWTQVESGGDVSIVAVQMTSNQETLTTFYNGFGGGWGFRRFGGGGFGSLHLRIGKLLPEHSGGDVFRLPKRGKEGGWHSRSGDRWNLGPARGFK